MSHYDQKPPTHRYGMDKRAIVNTNDDSLRRRDRFTNLIRGKSWLDVGAGSGAMLDLLAPLAKRAAAVEPQENASSTLKQLGYETFRRLEEVDVDGVDVITLFHVLEHIEYPEEVLKQCFDRLTAGGRLVVEVPHASDVLIRQFDLPAFKDFTFWSEHLVLYTRYTLETLVRKVGFSNIVVEGVQRYPVANHLNWLANGTPGGHITLDFMRDAPLDSAYEAMLRKLDMTDTLVLSAVKR
ncbi:class I SAM-dependent methyltransferase [Pontibacterium granulatum]|uniref:class I SAM-dependent methyltransferase n=1 Tax=Pontibacterium granulatum TaxID=2036029 RepID=UPI00249CED9E|nr:class I SAM-dependent methyltransferase [Pontibacterium granulatum]MDI3322904.1 class I SAM-dependent methyltransferase [Pontibacterium granulatum]